MRPSHWVGVVTLIVVVVGVVLAVHFDHRDGVI